jgi:hypothetical protein
MFVRREISENDRIRKKIRLLNGKTTADKFKSLLQDVLTKLDKIEAFNRYFDASLKELYKRVKEDHQDLLQTTSNEKVLASLVLCEEDTDQLLDDMTHTHAQGTYDKRLENILKFLKDFQNVSYERNIVFYENTGSLFKDQLQSISKDIQYKLSKMTYQIRALTEEIKTLENENIKRVKQLDSVNKASYEYKEITHQIQDFHTQIENNENTIKLIRSTMNGYRMISSLFQQLSMLDEYSQVLKEESYIRKLVKRLYKKPEELDILDNTADLVEVLNTMKKEILEVESVVKPAKKMIFDDFSDDADESVIEKYKAMAN